jgi:hypothetical protein
VIENLKDCLTLYLAIPFSCSLSLHFSALFFNVKLTMEEGGKGAHGIPNRGERKASFIGKARDVGQHASTRRDG